MNKILMHEDFKYPSKEEALGVKNEIPHLSDFGFNILTQAIHRRKTIP